MKDSEYRAHPALAQSDLQILLHNSGLHFHYKKYDPEYEPEEDKPSLIEGRAIHKIMLEGEDAFKAAYIRALEVPKSTKEQKAQHAEQKEIATHRNMEILDHKIFDKCFAITKKHEGYGVFNYFLDGETTIETPIFFSFESLDAKAMPDLINHDKRIIVDLKTTLHAGEKFKRDLFSYGYHRQGAFYKRSVESQYGGDDWQYYIFAIEKEPPFAYGIYKLDEYSLELGLQDMQRAANLYKIYRKGGFQSYNSGIEQIVSPPSWLLK